MIDKEGNKTCKECGFKGDAIQFFYKGLVCRKCQCAKIKKRYKEDEEYRNNRKLTARYTYRNKLKKKELTEEEKEKIKKEKEQKIIEKKKQILLDQIKKLGLPFLIIEEKDEGMIITPEKNN